MSVYKCPKCEAEFSLGTKFCEKCGCNLEVEFIEIPTCPICKKAFPTGTKFCNEHGIELTSSEHSNFVEKFGVLVGTICVIFFSLFSWIRAFGSGVSLFSGFFRLMSERATPMGWQLIVMILAIVMIVSFVLLIMSFFVESELRKSKFAYNGFRLCAIVTTVVIVPFLLFASGSGITLTIFPFLTLAVAILAMIFAVKYPAKNRLFKLLEKRFS